MKVEALGGGGHVEHCEAQSIAAGIDILLEQALVGEGGQQAVGGRLGDTQSSRQVADAPLALVVRERLEHAGCIRNRAEGGRPGDPILFIRTTLVGRSALRDIFPSCGTRPYGPGMGVLRLSHVDISAPDLELAAAYYTQVMGLDLVERTDDRLFLKCWDERDHHCLSIRYDPRVGIDRFSFKVEFEDDLDELRAPRRGVRIRGRAHQQG